MAGSGWDGQVHGPWPLYMAIHDEGARLVHSPNFGPSLWFCERICWFHFHVCVVHGAMNHMPTDMEFLLTEIDSFRVHAPKNN
jgi:hypothetical protein